MAVQPDDGAQLRRVIGPYQFFALAFGCIVGSGWVVVLGDWLDRAGPLGAVLGFAAGAAVMLCIALCYAELASRMPIAGSEVVYAQQLFGDRTAFAVSWFLALYLIAITAFEGVALAWIASVLVPGLQGRTLYMVLDAPVTDIGLAIGLIGALVIGALNYRAVQAAVGFHFLVTGLFIILAVGAMALAIGKGDIANLEPLLPARDGAPWWTGSLWIFATAAFWFNGFQAVTTAVEERASTVSFRIISFAMTGAILFAAFFYTMVVVSASMSVPWRELLGVEMATARAFDAVLPGHLLSTLVLIAAALSVVKVWNGASLMAARVVLSQGRLGFLPRIFGRVHPRHGTPATAVIVVAILNMLGVAMGKGAIGPIINMAAISVVCIFTVVLVGLLRARRDLGPAPYSVPGGAFTILIGLGGALVMGSYALIDPLYSARSIPLEWILLLCWALLGLLLRAATRVGRNHHD